MKRQSVFRQLAVRIGGPTALNGIDVRRIFRSFGGAPRYIADLARYRRMEKASSRPNFPLRVGEVFPCLTDYTDSSGSAEGHYFHQDLLVARKIFERRPAKHVDIGSRVDGFVAHLLCFMDVECVDIRDLPSRVPGLNFVRSDATELSAYVDSSLDSLSTLHAAEHFGLGRYGDPIDPDACFKFMGALQRVLAPNGRLYFAVPVGRERVEFNAHRVFAPKTILDAFSALTLVSFNAVMDDGHLYSDVAPSSAATAEYACGIFEFTKPAT